MAVVMILNLQCVVFVLCLQCVIVASSSSSSSSSSSVLSCPQLGRVDVVHQLCSDDQSSIQSNSAKSAWKLAALARVHFCRGDFAEASKTLISLKQHPSSNELPANLRRPAVRVRCAGTSSRCHVLCISDALLGSAAIWLNAKNCWPFVSPHLSVWRHPNGGESTVCVP